MGNPRHHRRILTFPFFVFLSRGCGVQSYRVIGPCEVAGVAPGGTVTQADLEAAGALIEPLLGVHLEAVPDEPKTLRKTAPARDDG